MTHTVFIPADFHLGPQHPLAYNSAGFLGKRKPLWFRSPTMKMRSGTVGTDCGGVRYEQHQQYLLISNETSTTLMTRYILYTHIYFYILFKVYLKMCINNTNVNMLHLATLPSSLLRLINDLLFVMLHFIFLTLYANKQLFCS